MKKLCLFLCLSVAACMFADNANRTMCVYDNYGYIYTFPVGSVDSVLFSEITPFVNIAPKHLTVYKGDYGLVEAQTIGAFPNEYYWNPLSVNWTFANDSIASASSYEHSGFAASACLIKGLRIGTTTLTATYGDYSASIEVEVLPMRESAEINDNNINQKIQDAYSNLIWLHDHWGYFSISELTTDECVCPTRNAGDWNDGGIWRDIHAHNTPTYSSSYYDLHSNIWVSSINGFMACNATIDNINHSAASDANKTKAIREIETLRCYFGYVLLDCFGISPLPEGEYVPGDYGKYKTTEQIWNELVECLERNAPALPKVTDANRMQYVGRATQGFAYSLLARLYLNAESFGLTPEQVAVPNVAINNASDFYTNALRCCNQVIASGSYAIEDNYFTNFKIHNESSKENIFVLVEDGSVYNMYSYHSMYSKARLQLLTLPYAMQQAWNMIERPWNGMCATKSFIDRFEYGADVRGLCDTIQGTDGCQGFGWFAGPVKKDGVVLPANYYWYEQEAIITPTISSFTNASDNDGARMIKYEVDTTGTYRYMENDFVLFRYADVLYMKAEAILRGAQGASLSSVLNDAAFRKIRQRAGVAPYTSLQLDELLDERGREFYWECVRRRDLIRFNKYKDPNYIDFLENTSADANGTLPAVISVNDFTTAQDDGVYIAFAGQTNEPSLLLFANATDNWGYKQQDLYEKYVYLNAGQKWMIVRKNAAETKGYYAPLAQKDILGDNYSINGYYGLCQQKNDYMTINQSGLYHIVIYSGGNSLSGAQLFVIPVEMGFSGGMNEWGWTKEEQAPTVTENGELVWTWTNVEVDKNTELKFRENYTWNYSLGDDGQISVCACMGENFMPCASNIQIPECGIYTIVLTYSMAGGDVKNSFRYDITRVGSKEIQLNGQGIGISGTMNDWSNPSGNMLAVYNEAQSNAKSAASGETMYVFNLYNITFETDNQFKFRYDYQWLGLSDIEVSGVVLTEQDSNISCPEGTYDIEITLTWDGCGLAVFSTAFTPK